MSPLDVRKRLHAFSEKLSINSPLSQKEYEFLADTFKRIADGEDANVVLGVKFDKGNSLSDAEKRQAISFIIHWIESAIRPADEPFPGLGYTVTKACNEAVPILRKILGVEESEKYDAEYIRQCFYKPEFAHMRSDTRKVFDQDSPFQP